MIDRPGTSSIGVRQLARRLFARTVPVTTTPSVPVIGAIDNPQPGAGIQRGTLIVRGWHLWGQKPAVAVAILLDGELIGRAAVTELRPDVAKALDNESAALSGWSAPVNLGPSVSFGEHEISVVVWGTPSEAPHMLPPIPIQIADGLSGTGTTLVGVLDWPLDGSTIEAGVTRIEGWVLHDALPVSSVEIAVNGIERGRARIGVDRLDVARIHSAPHAGFSGFELLIELTESASPTTIEIYTRLAGAERMLFASAAVQVAPASPVDTVGASVGVADNVASVPDITSSPVSVREGMNLVCVTHDLGLGGGQLWLSEALLKSGAGRDYPCTVVAPRPGPLRSEFEARGIRVHVTQEFPISNFESYEGRSLEMARWLEDHRFNVGLVNTFSSFPGADVLSRLGIPFVWGIHESFEPEMFWLAAYVPGWVDERVKALGMAALRRAQAVVFEAETTRLQWASYCAERRTLVLPYGIDTAAIQDYCDTHDRSEARSALGFEPHQRIILIMGTIEPRKAQSLAAQAFATVATDYPESVLVMVGDTGSGYGKLLRDYVTSSGLESQMRIVPVVPDTYEWYRTADVLLCASDVESLPRSVLEAMAFGVPILATSVFGLPELLTDGSTGFLYPPRDMDETSSAIRRVLDLSDSDLDLVGQAGKYLVRDRHDSAMYAASLRRLLESLASDPDVHPDSILNR